ncbi:YggS family pyridoxal phosphate-dependent enzyme [Calidifontibacter terrae]
MSDPRTTELQQRLETVRHRIARAAEAAGRDAAEICLVVVTKYFPADDVRRLVELGVSDIGENKDQEAAAKIAELSEADRAELRVHFIGQLQSNKAGHVASYADVVHSVDRPKIARALARGAERAGRQLQVLLQVDLDGNDPGRGGVLPGADLQTLIETVEQEQTLELCGLMAVAPRGEDPAVAFARLQRHAADLQRQIGSARWISAGMSGDLEQAVAAGATHLRVGSAILGSRPAQ